MKTKALILSALILVPTASAAAVQAAPAPAQDFRVSYTKAAPLTSSSVFSKTNLPQVLSDEELDGVTGEGILTGVAGAFIGGVGGALTYGIDLAMSGQKGNTAGALRAIGLGATIGAAAAYIPLP